MSAYAEAEVRVMAYVQEIASRVAVRRLMRDADPIDTVVCEYEIPRECAIAEELS